jgi:hypothetical protein
MDVHVEFSPSLALAVFASARWHTRENFLVSPSLLGKKSLEITRPTGRVFLLAPETKKYSFAG